jgi:membrane-associated phospholipid phosphatase
VCHWAKAPLFCQYAGMTRFQTWLASFAGTAVAVAIAYEWIDRPVSFYAHEHFAPYRFFGQLPNLSEWLFAVAAIVFVGAGAAALLGRQLTRWQSVVLLSSVSLTASETIKGQLKYVFGRTWPDTWVNNNPSLIHDGIYGFNPFHAGAAYGSFPSGHTAAACAVMSVLWLCYPQYRVLYALFVAAVVAGLIGANFHFVGDIFAGGFIGISTGYAAVLLWRGSQIR